MSELQENTILNEYFFSLDLNFEIKSFKSAEFCAILQFVTLN